MSYRETDFWMFQDLMATLKECWLNLIYAASAESGLTAEVLLTVDVLCSFLQLQENQDEIENMMNAIFKGVFVHRYR